MTRPGQRAFTFIYHEKARQTTHCCGPQMDSGKRRTEGRINPSSRSLFKEMHFWNNGFSLPAFFVLWKTSDSVLYSLTALQRRSVARKANVRQSLADEHLLILVGKWMFTTVCYPKVICHCGFFLSFCLFACINRRTFVYIWGRIGYARPPPPATVGRGSGSRPLS